jgi:hypothetical protein
MVENPLWLAQQEICGLFERALNPNAVVNISTPRNRRDRAGNRRQLDVEVIMGKGNRQVRSIVEVQKRRNEKVGINIYDGWITKKDRLNAALLICVSEAGFTEDVITAARHDHPYDVQLGLLQEVNLAEMNEHFVSSLSFLGEGNCLTTYMSDFTLLTSEDRVIIVQQGDQNRQVFGQLSMHDIFSRGLGIKPIPETLVEIELNDTPALTVAEIPDNPRIKKMRVTLKQDVSVRRVPLRTLLYRQIFPLEETIGACVMADNIRWNNVAGNFGMVLLPKPEDIECHISFKTLDEELAGVE